MFTALTWSLNGKSVLFLTWFSNNDCHFNMRFPQNDEIGPKDVKKFVVDNEELDTQDMTAASLIEYLRKGEKLSIETDTIHGLQEYSLAGS